MAKIAHGYAVAVLGLGFEHLLTDLCWTDYIGMARFQIPLPTDSIHIMGIKEESLAHGRRAVVVLLQFFGNHRTPLYKIITGLLA